MFPYSLIIIDTLIKSTLYLLEWVTPVGFNIISVGMVYMRILFSFVLEAEDLLFLKDSNYKTQSKTAINSTGSAFLPHINMTVN